MLIISFLRPAVPLTQDEADALQKLLEGAQVTIGHPIVAGTTTLEEVQQLLTQRGLYGMAGNLRTELSQSKHPRSMESGTVKRKKLIFNDALHHRYDMTLIYCHRQVHIMDLCRKPLLRSK